MVKDTLRESKREAERLYRYLVREFYEFKHLFDLVEEAKKDYGKRDLNKIRTVMKRFKSRLMSVFGEERVLKSMQKDFKKLISIYENDIIPNYKDGHKGKDLILRRIDQAKVCDAFLVKIGSRGGELQKACESLITNPADSQELENIRKIVAKSLEQVSSFEAVMKLLLKQNKKWDDARGDFIEEVMPAINQEIEALVKESNREAYEGPKTVILSPFLEHSQATKPKIDEQQRKFERQAKQLLKSFMLKVKKLGPISSLESTDDNKQIDLWYHEYLIGHIIAHKYLSDEVWYVQLEYDSRDPMDFWDHKIPPRDAK